MAKKISQLTQATEVKSDDVTVIVQDGETKKLPLNMMVTKQDIENKKVAGLAKLDEIEATYENDTYTPTITVKNKSSVKTGEGDEVDYSANVMDGPAKSAILSGKTLVNIPTTYNRKPLIGNIMVETTNLSMLKSNTKYLLKIINKSNYNITYYPNASSFTGNDFTVNGKSEGYVILTSLDTTLTHNGIVRLRSSNETITDLECAILFIEYQDGMENWDLPYFEGMQSVKLPVLTTTGKNLFNPRWLFNSSEEFLTIESDGSVTLNGTIRQHKWFNFTLPKGTYYPSCSLNRIHAFWTGGDAYFGYGKKITLNETTTIKGYISSGTYDNVNFTIQVEEGSVATSYEPYKSNILSAPQDLELRGIGDVRDTLDCITGEKVERISEVVLNGSENWQTRNFNPNNTECTVFTINFEDKLNSDILCDKFSYAGNDVVKAENVEGIYGGGGKISFFINVSNSKATTVEEFKSWLSTNNVTIQYLKTPTIKTVDLMPSGTHPSTTPYCWKNGHIQLSSSGLLPNLEYSVVTSRAGQINQNAAMIVKNDKRIFDLEILLAGGLVNTTYQALTLQNQVETGLSKVSLNSETEPDYLLYHMIMKLIEEKAYKLDDLTEKVSVFYLYEKLSDEQFETIYSALYPFVEDEIVEEPVVEELPEVVEDEVIM